jgi:hypothetical protein
MGVKSWEQSFKVVEDKVTWKRIRDSLGLAEVKNRLNETLFTAISI